MQTEKAMQSFQDESKLTDREFVVVAEGWNESFDRKTILDYLRRYNVNCLRKEFPETGFRRKHTLLLFFDSVHLADEAKTRLCQLNKKEMFKLQVRLHGPQGAERTYPQIDKPPFYQRDSSYSFSSQSSRPKLKLPTLNDYQKNAPLPAPQQNQDYQPYYPSRARRELEKSNKGSSSPSQKSTKLKKTQISIRNQDDLKPKRSSRSRSRSRSRKSENPSQQKKQKYGFESSENNFSKGEQQNKIELEHVQQPLKKASLIQESQTSSPNLLKDLKKMEQNTQSASHHFQTENNVPDFIQDISSGLSGNDIFQSTMSSANHQTNASQCFAQPPPQKLAQIVQIVELTCCAINTQNSIHKQTILGKIAPSVQESQRPAPQSNFVKPPEIIAACSDLSSDLLAFKCDILKQKELINLFLRKVPSNLCGSQFAKFESSIDSLELPVNGAIFGTPRKRKS